VASGAAGQRVVGGRGSVVDRAARRVVLRVLRGLSAGRLEVREGITIHRLGDGRTRPDLDATVTVHDPRTWRAVLGGGGLGAAEGYIRGWWTTDDPAAVCAVFVANPHLLESSSRVPGRSLVERVRHRRLRNTPEGSRINIAAHYDLSNDFFSLWLDPTLTYSSAVYETPDATLEQAQIAKIDRLCRRLQLGPDDHLLEIGTGWGAFAVHAAQTYGCRVTTTTISASQHEVASKRVAEAGLTDRVTVLDRDYRDLIGTYDKVVSVEMIEAVGAEFLGTYLRVIADRLKPEGLAAIQAIVIDDRLYERALRSVDYIKRYIFPGGFVPSVGVIVDDLAEYTDLRLVGLDDITPHYARTLREWRHAFDAVADEVTALGFDEAFQRQWRFYLAYCEAGFAERRISDVQILLAKPGFRGDALR
jgi:cyclopropane-fatty-acyl-phospholipid synthase